MMTLEAAKWIVATLERGGSASVMEVMARADLVLDVAEAYVRSEFAHNLRDKETAWGKPNLPDADWQNERVK